MTRGQSAGPTGKPRAAWRRELVQMIVLAAPLAGAQVTQMLMGLTDQVVMGHVDSDALAAGSLGTNLTFLLVVICQGVLAAIGPLVAQARGAGDTTRLAPTLAGGFVLATLLALPVMAVLGFARPLLTALGEPPALAAQTGRYTGAMLWGIAPALWLAALRIYYSAIERPRPSMVVAFAAFLLNGLLNWALVLGHLGSPKLGLAGSGTATASVFWFMTLTLLAYGLARRLIPLEALGLGRARFAWRALRQALVATVQLGWPIALMYALEAGLFCFSAILMGLFGPVALAGHQIAMGVASLSFMVPFAIGQAATVRVGFHTGAGQPQLARLAGFTALAVGIGFMALMSGVLMLVRQPVTRIYLAGDDPMLGPVTSLGVSLLALAALFQVFDGAQIISAGALRGLKDTRTPLLAGLIGYWGLGFSIGSALAFGLGWGPIGLWWGFVIGLATAAVLLTWRFERLSARLLHPPVPLPAAANQTTAALPDWRGAA